MPLLWNVKWKDEKDLRYLQWQQVQEVNQQ